MITTISNIIPYISQNYFSLAANFYGKTVSLLSLFTCPTINVVQDQAKRIRILALFVFGVAIALSLPLVLVPVLNWLSDKLNSPKPATLKTEFSAAKQALLVDRELLEKATIDLEHTCAAKIFLTMIHNKQPVTDTCIISQIPHQIWTHKQIKDELIRQIDSLFDRLQNRIAFNDDAQTEFKIGILFKDTPIEPCVDALLKGDDMPLEIKNQYLSPQTFSQIIGSVKTYKGQTSNDNFADGTRFELDDQIQQDFCEAMDITFAPQINASNEFI